jgi:hypothetical protein
LAAIGLRRIRKPRLLGAVLAACVLPAALGLAPSARAAIKFIGASTAQTPFFGASSLTLPPPTAVAQGEVEIATVSLASAAAITPPAGWTQIIDTQLGSSLQQASFWHLAGSSEANATFAFGASSTAAGGIAAYAGVDPVTIIDAAAAQAGSGATASVPSLNASYAGDLVLGVGSFANDGALSPGRPAAQRYTASAAALGGPALLAQDEMSTAAGQTAGQSINDLLAGRWIAQAIALKAAGPGGTLSVSTSAAPSFAANLDAGDQTATYSFPLSVVASASPPPGWNLAITSTQFSNGSATLPASASQIAAAPAVSCVSQYANCSPPSNSISYPVAVPAGTTPPSPAKFFDAAPGSGAGLFTVTPTVEVSIPQNSFAGTYTSTLTISIASGP